MADETPIIYSNLLRTCFPLANVTVHCIIMGVRINFSRGDNINALLILVMLLTMQCKCTFTKHLTFSTRLHHKDGASAYWLSHMKQ